MNASRIAGGAAITEDYETVLSTTKVFLAGRIVVNVGPMSTSSHIESVATTVWKVAKGRGGDIPYTVVRELVENFIHAGFEGAAVAVGPDGCGLAFFDDGPGMRAGRKCLEVGVSTADGGMMRYIRGVGSGLPIVADWAGQNEGWSFDIDFEREKGNAVFISTSEMGAAFCETMRAVAKHADSLGVSAVDALGGTSMSDVLGPSRFEVGTERLAGFGNLEPVEHIDSERTPCPIYK